MYIYILFTIHVQFIKSVQITGNSKLKKTVKILLNTL